jgi:hypothetical protein
MGKPKLMKSNKIRHMKNHYQYNDGGRKDAGYKGHVGDCVVRAIAIASSLPYEKIRTDLMRLNKGEAKNGRGRIAKQLRKQGNTTRRGTHKKVYHDYILSLGFTWVPTMQIGSGCSVHMCADELPNGTLILRVSKHLSAFVDGVLHDTFDHSRNGTRCVYGFYLKGDEA